jgi:hypothetical protein
MKRLFFLFLMLTGTYAHLSAQGDYLVSTNATAASSTDDSAEQQFINANFPYYRLCDWVPGMRFLCIPERKDILIPVFKAADTEQEVSTGAFKYKLFEYLGYENTERGHMRLHFECEGAQYYYEQKNISFEEYCLKPKAGVPSLAYLGDVDLAKELLVGQTLYLRTNKVRVDDNATTSGYRDVTVTVNTKVKVTAVGVFSRSFPVKIVFQDEKGNTYFQGVALSRTNSGMIDNDFIMDNKNKLFINSFSFGDANAAKSASLMTQYGHKSVYLKSAMSVTKADGSSVQKPRYTQFKVTDIITKNGTPYVQLKLTDTAGETYLVRTTFTHTDVAKSLLQTEDYFGDLFAIGDLRKQYPAITEGEWELVANGEVRKGMSPDACRLALGDPLRVQRVNGEYETWYYERKILEFTNKKLERVQ